MLTADLVELAAVRSSFSHLIARWRLTQGELKALLRVPDPFPCGRVLPDALSLSGETRMRLLLRLDRAIGVMCEGADVGRLLREPYLEGGPTPLEDLTDLDLLRASVRVAEDRGAEQSAMASVR